MERRESDWPSIIGLGANLLVVFACFFAGATLGNLRRDVDVLTDRIDHIEAEIFARDCAETGEHAHPYFGPVCEIPGAAETPTCTPGPTTGRVR